MTTYDMSSDIIRYEEGDMDDEEVIAFFQKLVDSGLAWSLQGSYGRTAHALIEQGLVTNAREKPKIGASFDRPKSGAGSRPKQERRKRAS